MKKASKTAARARIEALCAKAENALERAERAFERCPTNHNDRLRRGAWERCLRWWKKVA